VQVTHAPALHTWFDPQMVPFAAGAPLMHSELPVEQSVAPT
jgi:hypothetical protein